MVVLFYHAHLNFMIGGYLGVEIFFVISGFLITSLLLNEAAQNQGRIDLRRFWQRRFLRLLPALLALLVAVTLLGAFVLQENGAQFRMDIVASLFYVENWQQIRSGSSYFADQGLPLLRHIWSLAVEEQFYLLWPLLVAAVLKLFRGSVRPLLLLTLLLFTGSLATAQILCLQCDPAGADYLDRINRIYLGTDTRAFGILLGAMLAMTDWKTVLHGWRARLLNVLSLLSLVGLLAVSAVLDAADIFLYRGGFLLVDVMTLLVIAGLVRTDRSLIKGLLDWRPLEYIGQRSYGIYLWHWPVFRLLGPGEPEPLWSMGKIALALLVADVSYRWLETPVRQGGFGALFPVGSGFMSRARRVACGSAFGSMLVATAWGGVLLAQQPAYVDEVAESLRRNAVAIDRKVPIAETAATELVGPPRPPGLGNGSAEAPPPALRSATAALTGDVHITAIGDSVMKGAALALKQQARARGEQVGIYVDAEESRSFDQAAVVLEELKKAGALGDVVVVHLGTNNSFIDDKKFARLAELLADRRQVLFLTVKSDKTSLCDTVNAALARNVGRMENARLLDWQGVSSTVPDIFYSDRTHLRQSGANYYATAIFDELDRTFSEPASPPVFIGPPSPRQLPQRAVDAEPRSAELPQPPASPQDEGKSAPFRIAVLQPLQDGPTVADRPLPRSIP